MIYIPGNCPSSKNSRIWTGRFLVDSKLTKEYRKNVHLIFIMKKEEFLRDIENKEKPYLIGLYFNRKSRHRFDYHNSSQILMDLMVEYGWIEDDDADNVKPIYIGYEYNKEDPGVKIQVLKSITYEY